MNEPTVLVALLGIFSAVITAAFSMATWSQKKVSTTQDKLVAVLTAQVATEREDKKLLAQDNREQAITIGKMGVSIDKLVEQGARTISLMEKDFYGRTAAADR